MRDRHLGELRVGSAGPDVDVEPTRRQPAITSKTATTPVMSQASGRPGRTVCASTVATVRGCVSPPASATV